VRVYTHLSLGQLDAVYNTPEAGPLVERGYDAMKLVFIP